MKDSRHHAYRVLPGALNVPTWFGLQFLEAPPASLEKHTPISQWLQNDVTCKGPYHDPHALWRKSLYHLTCSPVQEKDSEQKSLKYGDVCFLPLLQQKSYFFINHSNSTLLAGVSMNTWRYSRPDGKCAGKRVQREISSLQRWMPGNDLWCGLCRHLATIWLPRTGKADHIS